MKKSDRLMAILIALQQRPETAQSLADKLEVSKRTILRDMQALSEIGIPLYGASGPAGGFRLMEGYKLPPLHFDSDEALTLLFSLSALTKLADSPFNRARWTAMDKLRAALPSAVLKRVEPLLRHIEIDVPERSYKAPLLEKLLKHTGNGLWLRILYRSEKAQRWLHLLPKRVYTAYGYWYCEAFSQEHGETRTFRVDRMKELEPASAPGEETLPPTGPCKERGTKEEAGASIFIRAALTYRGALLAEQDPHIGDAVKQISDEEWEVGFHCPDSEWNWAVAFFFNLGLDANVIEPPELRRELLARAGQMRERYRDP